MIVVVELVCKAGVALCGDYNLLLNIGVNVKLYLMFCRSYIIVLLGHWKDLLLSPQDQNMEVNIL